MKLKHPLLLITIVLLSLSSSMGSLHAAVLVQYQFNGGSAAQTSGDATGSTVTFGAFTGQAGTNNVGVSSLSESTFVRWDATGTNGSTGDTLAEAITNQAYFTFTLTNTTGQVVDLTNLTFEIYFNPYGSGVIASVFAMTDLSGYTDGDELGGVTYASGTGPGSSGRDTIDVGLSSLGNLGIGASIETRLYFVDDGDSNNNIFRVDNVIVNGTAVPEPAAPLLGAMGSLLLLRRRRA